MRVPTWALALGVIATATVSSTGTVLWMRSSNGEWDRNFVPTLHQIYGLVRNESLYKGSGKELLEGAMAGMVHAAKDPHSEFMNAEEMKRFESAVGGMSGIGIKVSCRKNLIYIQKVLPKSPAEEVGLQMGDRIVRVGDNYVPQSTAVEEDRPPEAAEAEGCVKMVEGIRGTPQTRVQVEVERLTPGGKQQVVVNPMRRDIDADFSFSPLTEDGIAVIKIGQFTPKLPLKIKRYLESLGPKVKGIVADVRDNGGGFVESCKPVTELFVPVQKALYQIEDRKGNTMVERSQDGSFANLPVVVLTNEGTASAAEIFAAALRESAGRKLVGAETFGKGTMQRVLPLLDGSSLKLSMASWKTPNGTKLAPGKALKPDLEVENQSLENKPIPSADPVLQKGSRGIEVKYLQQILTALGYVPGRDDGQFDERTASALQQFQANYQTNPSRTYDAQTATQLRLVVMQRLQDDAQDLQLEQGLSLVRQDMRAKG